MRGRLRSLPVLCVLILVSSTLPSSWAFIRDARAASARWLSRQASAPPIQFEFRFDGGSPDMHQAVQAAGGIWSNHLLSSVPVRVDVKFTALGAVLSAPGFAPPASAITSVYYPLNNQLETFVVGADGAVYVIWKAQNDVWNAPVPLTAAGFAPPGSPMSAVYYPLNEQLEVFVVDNAGAVNVLWKAQNGTWNAPVPLTAAGFAPLGAPLAAVYYPLNEQLEVFVVDNNGAINVLWKAQNGTWNAPVALTAPGLAPSGASLSGVYYPLNEQLEVFVADVNGAVEVLWKAQNGAWNPPAVLTGPGFAPAGAALTSAYYPLNEQLEVFFIDNAGAVDVLWKAQNGAWNSPVAISAAGLTTPGSQLRAAYYPPNEQLEVLFMGSDGAWYVTWKAQNGAWNVPVGLSTPAVAPAGAPVSVTFYPLNNQLEAFVIGVNGDVNLAWKVDNGSWSAPAAKLASASGGPLAIGSDGMSPAPLQEALQGENLNEDKADITMEINTNVPWYTGLDAAVPRDRFDLVSTVLHELGHGLGFAASTCRGGDPACDATAMTDASYRRNGRETLPFTSFIEDASGTRIDTYDLSMPNMAANLLAALTSGQLFWGGPGGIAAAGGQRPQLFASANWSPGSSVSHLDEATYPYNDLNALMTPQLGFGESNQQPGGITLGIFADLGWQIRTYPPLMPAMSTWSVYQPLNEQLEVLTVDGSGALTVRWKANNELWNAPVGLTGPGLAPANAPVATAFYPLNNQLEAFLVGNDGAVYLIWKAQNDVWNSPVPLTAAGFAPPGAPLAALYYPLNEQLEVFVVDNTGAINVLWKAQNGTWNVPVALTGPGLAPSGASLSGVYYPLNEQLEVFVVDNTGAINVLWKAQNGTWNAPVALTVGGLLPPGGGLTSVYYPPNEQLEVHFIDNAGAVEVLWKAQNGTWNTPVGLGPAGQAPPGAAIASVYYPLNEQLETFFIDGAGALNVLWKVHNGTWAQPVAITPASFAAPGGSVAATYYWLGTQLEVFASDAAGGVQLMWKALNSTWRGPFFIG